MLEFTKHALCTLKVLFNSTLHCFSTEFSIQHNLHGIIPWSLQQTTVIWHTWFCIIAPTLKKCLFIMLFLSNGHHLMNYSIRVNSIQQPQQPPVPLPTGRYLIDPWYSCHLKESLYFSWTDRRTYLSILIAQRLRMLAVHIMTSNVTKMSQWILLKRHSPTTCNTDTCTFRQ